MLELFRNVLGLGIAPNWPWSSWTVKTIWLICQCAKITAGNLNLEEVLQLQWCDSSLSLCEMPSLTLWVCIPFLAFIMDRISSHKSIRQISLFLWKQRATRSPRLCQQGTRWSFVINLGMYLNRDVPNLDTLAIEFSGLEQLLWCWH